MTFVFIMLVAIVIAVAAKLFKPKAQQGPARSTAELPEPSAEVRQFAASGQRVVAVKLYRQQTGATLRESKDVVDAISTANRPLG